jgi:UDP-GlcNAc:undecaprenyl-phosphate GlcNAc-1-phosphate transferase
LRVNFLFSLGLCKPNCQKMTNDPLLNIFAFGISFIIVCLVIPPIIRVSKAKKLFARANERTVHNEIVPSVGGIAIFISFVITTLLLSHSNNSDFLHYLIASVTLVFFVGLKDDILIMSCWKKLGIQCFAAIILISLGNIRISNLQGVFGLHEINYVFSYVISLIFIAGTVNALNLIDGVDGLASGLGIISSSIFGSWFFMNDHVTYSVMSFTLTGSLTCFFIFNVFGRKNKLFLGDSGSLIVGLVIAALTIEFLRLNAGDVVPHRIPDAPAVAFAILFIPLFDLCRIFYDRVSKGKSPLQADSNHIHHHLLHYIETRMKVRHFAHLKVTLIIVLLNLCIIPLPFILSRWGMNINFILLIMCFTGYLTTVMPFKMYKTLRKRDFMLPF